VLSDGLNVLGAVLVHPGAAIRPHDLWQSWSFPPGVMLGLVLSGALYVIGFVRLRHRGRGQAVRGRETACFALGWLVLAVALVSPLHELGEALLTAHMVQHELLMLLAAPLLVLGRPLAPTLWGLPAAARYRLGRLGGRREVRSAWAFVTRPAVAWSLHATAVLLWHLPPLYQRSMLSETAHAAQHASFLITALLFWWALLHGHEARGRAGAAVLYLFGAAVYTGGLGALLTISTRLWYPLYLGRTAPWGLTPLDDQRLAGLLMWMPGALVYLVAALGLAAGWLREADRRVLRWEALRSGARLLLVLALAGLIGCKQGPALSAQEAAHLTRGGDARRGADAIRRFGCGACHTIPGIAGANGQVGSPLAGVGGRAYIAGVLTNTPEHMVRWIVNPPEVDSLTAMPLLGVSPAEARDIAAYLYTRR
jgi:cytochrome c oxidase assembly factor CtaG/cytochrome c2